MEKAYKIELSSVGNLLIVFTKQCYSNFGCEYMKVHCNRTAVTYRFDSCFESSSGKS